MLDRLIKKIIAALQWCLGRFRLRACGFEIGKKLTVRGEMYIEKGENSFGAVGNDCNFTRIVIGSGSIVVKDIPNDCIAAGNPARNLRDKGKSE